MNTTITKAFSRLIAAALSCGAVVTAAAAATFPYPAVPDDDLVGQMESVPANPEETLLDTGRAHDMGYEEIVAANPEINRWVPEAGQNVLLPTQFILPAGPREGIVLNLPELRLYYFPPVKRGIARIVKTYPVSIGRMDWKTPIGRTKVTAKEKNPAWRPTRSIREEHAQDGEELPAFIPGGHPDNPLGRYALRLALPSYLIHGVDQRKAFGIGMRVTHGCVRMYPEDIEELFSQVAVGTPVAIVDQPIKAGWRGSLLYLEVHLPFEEETEDHSDVSFIRAVEVLQEKAKMTADINWDVVEQMVRQGDGVPRAVGTKRANRREPPRPPAGGEGQSTVRTTYTSTS